MAVVEGLPGLPRDCLDRVTGCHDPAWVQYCALAKVCSALSGTLKDEALWRREFAARFDAPEPLEGDQSPSRVAWQQRFQQRHCTEREFLLGAFGLWSRDERGKCFAVRFDDRGSRVLAAFEGGHVASYRVGHGSPTLEQLLTQEGDRSAA